MICANLTDDLLVAAAAAIVDRLAPGGTLVLAGIRAAAFPKVRRVYAAAGLRLRRAETRAGWRSGAFGFAPGRRSPPGRTEDQLPKRSS